MLGVGHLAGANAMVHAVTIVAILGGVFLFSLLFEWRLAGVTPDEAGAMLRQVAPLGWLLVVCSLAEWLLTFRIGPGVVGDAGERFEWRRYVGGRYLRRNLRTLRDNRVIWLSIIGLSVFWGVSQVVLAAFPAYAKEVLGEESVLRVQGVLACAGIGIVLGSLLAGRASRHFIETGLLPLATLGMVVALALLPRIESLAGLGLVILLFGLCGGLFIVPLNALIQFHAGERRLGRVLAGNNWVQNITMLLFLGVTALFSVSGGGSLGLFYLITLVAAAGALSGYRTLAGVLALSRWIGRQGEEGSNIGLLLPTSSAGLMANAAALLRGRTLVNLNYSAGAEALGAALERCAITTVYTSHRFLERLGRRGVSLDGLPDGVRLVYLEDFRERTGRASALLHWLLGRLLPARLLLRLYGRRVAIDAPAAILFSSGSEGRPKEVVLSHRNLMGNIRQISDVLDTREEDRVMATLPLFHAFGLKSVATS
ncbi:MAG: MFS transporter [Candidatus Sedimenticola endophacoides]